MSDADTLQNAASAQPADVPEQQQDSADLFGGLKKKKKDKKKLDLDLDLDENDADNKDANADADAPADDDELNFGELKKKKKSKKKVALDLDAFEKEIGEADDNADDADAPTNDAYADVDDEQLGDNPFAQDAADDADAPAKDSSIEAWQGTDRDYTYQELLGRVFNTLRAQNPALSGDKKKFTMVPPQVARDGSKKTVFANVVDICKRMHRQPEHVIQFLFAELGTIGSVDGAQRLVIRGRFQPKQIENVLRRYITEYVICKTCKRPETKLTKENRIFFVTCEKCGSQRSVSAIKSGFQAQTGKRSKIRAAAGA
ncbi:eukaryotic translation initiation factor 2 beta [Moesziomyces antarcticus]|uniref:Probable SUI3 - translation initiation factor eIF2 beta subunit n=1 Tax=Pseudozyma antarctica TaxID=84753 RepID=A0A5C3FFU0_PSEA2|nr:eukaryotic translation initiation factor 2 beta [Moesziomyces antarcticus]GAK63246.1 eukaryotic translation initiation factor 2 beta [Moesziomyces antarcticus]SPO43264.1 probable SUI3 - translation initiation factor eIF2 beta subunit [Moesziomyces antarcticus]